MKSYPEGARVGMTLLELMLVLFLLSILFGISLGFFATLDLGRRQVRGIVKNVLRSAQNTAIAARAPSRVRVDASSGVLVAEALQVVGTWHFEDRSLAGAFGLDGMAEPELFVEDGYLGSCLSFAGRIGFEASIPVQNDPAFDFRDGFAIECAVCWQEVGGGRLLSIGDACSLEIGGGGEIRGRFTAASEREGRLSAGSSVVVQSPPAAVTPARWTRVRLQYDRRELWLEIDGIEVASVEENAPVWRVAGPLVLSDARRPFPGSIDELVVSAIVAGEEARLPDSVRLVDAPALIHFAPGGGLDRDRHPEPVRLVLAFEDGERDVIAIGSYGTVE